MKRICIKSFVSFIFVISALNNSYAAEVIEDDSVPYIPYPERIEIVKPAPEQTKQTPAKNTQKKQTTKKTTPKKSTKNTKTTKKTTSSTKKTSTQKISSLERGIALMKAERYGEAQPYLLKAIQEERNNPNAWYWYGVYHEKTGGFHQAQYFYSKAVTIDPAFEPLSRVVYYPEDSEKTPLWDPKRPARVYPVATANKDMAIAGRGNFPSAPNDPEIPKVPVYTPPEPDSNPMAGDSWTPAVYVPPMPEEAPVNMSTPVYNPPELQRVEAEIPEIQPKDLVADGSYSYKIPGYSNTYTNSEKSNVRVDTPLYNPPKPGQVVAKTPPKPAPVVKEEVKPADTKKKTTQVKTTPRKVVKKAEKVEKTKKTEQQKQVKNTKTNTKTKTDKDIKPDTKTITKKSETKKPAPEPKTVTKKVQPKPETKTQETPKKPEPKVQKPETKTAPEKSPEPKPEKAQPQPKKNPEPVKPPEPVKQPEKPEKEQKENQEQTARNEYLPPVGQTAPDPGTVPETSEILMPPVGQGSQY